MMDNQQQRERETRQMTNSITTTQATKNTKQPVIKLGPLKRASSRARRTQPKRIEVMKRSIQNHLGEEHFSKANGISGYDLGSTDMLSALSNKNSPEHEFVLKVTEINIHIVQRLSAARLLWDILPEMNMFADNERRIIKALLYPIIRQMKAQKALFFIEEYALGNMHQINPENFLVKLEDMVREIDQMERMKRLKVKETKKTKAGKTMTVYASKKEAPKKKTEIKAITPTVVVRKKRVAQ